MGGEKKRHGLQRDYEVNSSVSMACFWPVTAARDEELAAFLKAQLLAVFRPLSEDGGKKKPGAERRVFHEQASTYCRGSTLSNTRFASNELSSINC